MRFCAFLEKSKAKKTLHDFELLESNKKLFYMCYYYIQIRREESRLLSIFLTELYIYI